MPSLRPFINVTIQQITSYFANGKEIKRNETINLDFVTSCEAVSCWENHTDTCKIEFPKNVYLKTDKALFGQAGSYNVILGSEATVVDSLGELLTFPPLIMRGDSVTVQDGYWFKNEVGTDIQVGGTFFSGFVSKVESSIPIKIECEDNFYLLKRTPVNLSIWRGNLIDLCKLMMQKVNALFADNAVYNSPNGNFYPSLSVTNITDSITANFSLGHLDIGDITVSQLLDRLGKQYHLDSFFRGNELHFGFPIYTESTANSDCFFEFENNILDHDLEYKNKSDVILSAIVSCKTINPTGRKTRDGQESTKWEKDSVLIYWDIPTDSFKSIVKKKEEPFPSNTGERHDFIYPIDPRKGKPSVQTLIDYGIEHLKKYYYTGFRGSFTTIGYPFIYWGDNVNIISEIMADRNGQYKVSKIERKHDLQGIRQVIHIDYKLEVPMPSVGRTLTMM